MRSIIVLVCVAVVASALRIVPAPTDHCTPYTDCESCVNQNLCGWCSEPVVYPHNITGPQCAGFSANGSLPFACNGIYSTEQCVAGYICDMDNYTCVLGQPGQGNTLAQCEVNCTNDGQVYLCNTTTQACYQVPRGTPGSASYAVCMASCTHPSSKPSSSSPQPTTPTSLYTCNYTSGQCVTAPPGQGESLQVCMQNCQPANNNSYMCNKFLQQCEQLPPSIPGGETLAQCEATCIIHPNPGPQPTMVGLWRGVRIDNGYVIGEFDLSINQTTVVFVGKIGGKDVVTLIGLPFYIPASPLLEMWINITSGPGAGETIKTISDQGGAPGPETKYMTTAMSAPGGATPSAITAAMTDKTDAVFAFGACQTPDCAFIIRDILPPKNPKTLIGTPLKDVDHCSQYGDSCPDCISHQYCGWCSVNVTYKDGSQGTQCAGFNNQNGTSGFVCAGRYSTLSCDQGYICNMTSLQCIESQPGNGVPLKECETLCIPTPPPTPAPPQYVCNITSKQCYLCNTTHCPGSMPLGQCEAACTNPKPGPHGNLIGVWRGVRIQNGYKVGEIEMVFTKTNYSYFAAGVYQYTANITSLGADLMLLEMLDGTYKGWKFAAIYQSGTEASGMYDFITFAKGVLGQSAPASYPEAMYTPGMQEYIMAKCDQAPCVFNAPTQ